MMFKESELVGLTLAEAHALKRSKDLQYLTDDSIAPANGTPRL